MAEAPPCPTSPRSLPRSLHSGVFLAHNIRMSIATAGIRLAGLDEASAIAHLSRDTIEAGLPWRWQPADIERFMHSTRHNVIVAEETVLNLALPAADGSGAPDALGKSGQPGKLVKLGKPGAPSSGTPSAGAVPAPQVRNGKVMSGFAVMGYGDNDAYLALLSVKPEWRRRSIGRTMVEWLLKCAEVGGVKRVDVELRADNEAALSLYHSLQFAEIARKPGGYYGTVSQVRMRRVLRR